MSRSQAGDPVPVGSDRVRFYFERQKMIDEWASLRQEAASEVRTWVEGRCFELLDAIADDLSLRSPVEATRDYPGIGPTCGLAKS
ncbi:hypothetical protein ACE2AJ_00400 [Aquihabitans daechungensis]|uniref:hypothetical protein n=1 Tax=Aquihabitans daechungensis TaxID=1052257 RepID=UPI003BA2B349